jgi:hypothetical protein
MRVRRIVGRGVLVCVVAGFVLTGCGTGPSASTSTSVPPKSTSSTTTTPPTTAPPGISPYLALWPFRTVSDVESWQQLYSSNGIGAWHLNSSTTALNFVSGYLGFAEINAIIETTTNGTGTHVAVGFHPTSSSSVTSAVVHLVRWGTGPDAPWEVVGTDDTTFSLTTPAYGAEASSPVQVGGTITGADENISVKVRQPSSSSPIGSYCCTPAGGTASPWSATVSYAGATDPVLTIVAATGGHVQAVERFTVTGVRSTPPSASVAVEMVAHPTHAVVGRS